MKFWFYKDGETQSTQVSRLDLIDQLQKGKLPADTMVWHSELDDWKRACDIDYLAQHLPTGVTPPPLPVPVKAIVVSTQTDPTGSQVRPWARFWARMLDTFAAGMVLNKVLCAVYSPFSTWNPVPATLVLVGACCALEPLCIGMFGTTLGKSLLRIDVRTKSGEKLTVAQAFRRSLGVWFYGWGMALIPVMLVTWLVAYWRLTRRNITTWDRKCDLQVSHRTIGWKRGWIAAVLILGLLLFSLAQVGSTVPSSHETKTDDLDARRMRAEKGDTHAMTNLGFCYFKGEGVPKDEAAGVAWFRKAADLGNATAMYNLGLCYANGTGVPRDETEALKWQRKAADLGDTDAQKWLRGLSAKEDSASRPK